MITANETREDKFKRLAESRVNAIIDKIRLIGHLSNRSNYSYNEAQVDAMFKAIQKELSAAKSKFSEGSNGNKPFSLS